MSKTAYRISLPRKNPVRDDLASHDELVKSIGP